MNISGALQSKVGMGMGTILKLCSITPCSTPSFGIPNTLQWNFDSTSFSKFCRIKPLVVIHRRPMDPRTDQMHCRAQTSTVDNFLQGNNSHNKSDNSPENPVAQLGQNGEDDMSQLDGSKNMDDTLNGEGGLSEKGFAPVIESSEAEFLDLAKESESAKKSSQGASEKSGSVVVNSEKGDLDFRLRKQVVKRSNVIAKQVISMTSAFSMGFVSQLWVDTDSWIVQMIEIRPSLLSGEMDRLYLKDLCQVGDVILVEDENVLENDLPMIGLDSLVGYSIMTEDRYSLGKVRDYKFNINLGNVVYLEFDSFGIPFIPSSLVSTYGLLVEDVLEVASDTIVVRSVADVKVQRLTKGLWEAPNLDAEVFNDTMLRKSNHNSSSSKEYGRVSTDDELERRFEMLSKKYYSNRGRRKKSAFKDSNIKDEWGSPLDY